MHRARIRRALRHPLRTAAAALLWLAAMACALAGPPFVAGLLLPGTF